MTIPPLTFESRSDGRTAVMLGAHEIGSILPVQIDHLRAAYVCHLPPVSGPVYVRDERAAKMRLRRHVAAWVKIAHLKDAGDAA